MKTTRLTTYIAGGFLPGHERGWRDISVWIKPVRRRVSTSEMTGPMLTLHITPRNDPTGYFAKMFREIQKRDSSPEVAKWWRS